MVCKSAKIRTMGILILAKMRKKEPREKKVFYSVYMLYILHTYTYKSILHYYI